MENEQKYFKRNLFSLLSWEFIWGLGGPCCMMATIVPLYLHHLGTSKTYIQTVTVSITMPLPLLPAPLSGILVDHFGKGGYIASFTAGITLSLCVFLGYFFIIREPRSGQDIYIGVRKI